MASLAELVERVRTGTGEDRELDAAIIAGLNNAIVKPYPPSNDFGPHDRWQFWSRDGSHFLGSESKFPVPPLTTSLDAVVRLVEEKLPGWATHYLYHAIQWLSAAKRGPRDVPVEELPRAVLTALLLALQAQEAEGT